MTTEHTVVRLQRTISASPERVYRAWLEPELLQRWMAPGSMQVARVEVDERVGGRYRIWQQHAGGDVGGFECELLELLPSERIVWRWGFVGPARDDGPTFDSRLTVTLREVPGGGTELTLVHEHLDALHQAMPDVAESVDPGWAAVVDKLAATVDPSGVMNSEPTHPATGTELTDTPTLFVCHGDNGGPRMHPCRRVQEALRAAGIPYEKVIAGHGSPWPFLRKGSREQLRAATGAAKLPALKLPDGTILTHSRAILSWISHN
jgi:uncharacterized protein YndB with AHSA1/START domain